jgi:hypothetical protein
MTKNDITSEFLKDSMAGAVIKLLDQWPLENSGMVFDSLEGRKSNFSFTQGKKDME